MSDRPDDEVLALVGDRLYRDLDGDLGTGTFTAVQVAEKEYGAPAWLCSAPGHA